MERRNVEKNRKHRMPYMQRKGQEQLKKQKMKRTTTSSWTRSFRAIVRNISNPSTVR